MKKRLLLPAAAFFMLCLFTGFANAAESDFQIEDGVLTAYTGKTAVVVIPDTVTEIGENVFAGNKTITDIYLPNSVARVDMSAFEDCKNLDIIRVESLDSWLALECENCYANPNYYASKFYIGETAVTDLVLPEVDSIRDYAFCGFGDMVSVEIPDSVTQIGEFAFYECKKIKTLVLPDSVEEVGYCAFAKCTALTSAVISSAMTEIPEDAFLRCCNMKSVTLPEGLEVIGPQAFAECCLLADFEFPSTLTEIGAGAFYNGNWYLTGQKGKITNLVIPEGVEMIGDLAFAYCGGIKTIDLPSTLEYLGGGAFLSCTGLEEPVEIPEGVTEIPEELFADCENLTGVILSDGLKTINNSFVLNCSALESVVIPSSVIQIERGAFDNCDCEVVAACDSFAHICLSIYGVEHSVRHTPGDISEGQVCTACGMTIGSEQRIDVPDFDSLPKIEINIKKIDAETFRGTGAEYVVIGSKCTLIAENAFADCDELKYVTVPYTVRRIGANAFHSDNVVFICDYSDTIAWEYAKENGIPCIMK